VPSRALPTGSSARRDTRILRVEATDLLKRVPLFSDLEDRELQQIANSMKQRRFSAGQQIAVEGQSGVGFFVIEDGTAKVTVGGDEVRMLGPGDYFGEVALITQGARTATVTADTDLTTWGMTFWDFRPLVEDTPSIAWKLLQSAVKQYDQSAR
jgi:CRP/FNR family cyclic AMP-dependent transcriptional regulator